MSDFAEWYQDWVGNVFRKGDWERFRLSTLHAEASSLAQRDTASCLTLLREGQRLAETLGESWWKLFYDQSYINISLHELGDCSNTLDLAVANVMELRKPEYATFPRPEQSGLNLASVYLAIDPVGYERQIREVLTELDASLEESGDCDRAYVAHHITWLAVRLGRLDEAEQAALRELALAEEDETSSPTYATYACSHLCRIAYRRGNWADLATWTKEGLERAHRADEHKHRTVMMIWQAVAVRHAGDETKAQQMYRFAQAYGERLSGRRYAGYFNASSAYHELAEEWEQVLDVRQRNLEHIQGKGRLHEECWVRTRLCEALARLGRLTSMEMDRAREAASRLQKPEQPFRELDRIASLA